MNKHFFKTEEAPWIIIFNQEANDGVSITDVNWDKVNRILFFSDIDDTSFYDIIKKCNGKNQTNIWLCFMSNHLNDEVLQAITIVKNEIQYLKFIFSCNLAIKYPLDNTFYIGGYHNEFEVINSYPINLGDSNLPLLDYHEFKKTIPKALEIAETIMRFNFPSNIFEICSIVYLDNWIQSNIQYIKDRVTIDKYITPNIKRISRMSDVLLNHYGTCEDISASIVCILEILGIKSTFVGSNSHTWIVVSINDCSYIWDPTHNITRNPKLHPSALKAIEYSDKFTLVGAQDKYYSFPQLFSDLSNVDFSRDQINEAKRILREKYDISFSYGLAIPVDSYLLDT